MRNHGYQNYLDDEVLAASPLKLVQLLYGAALDSIAEARRHLRFGDIRGRSRAITKAMRIVTELSRCLNHEAGGELSLKLAGVYGYVLRQLMDANVNQIDPPLAEAEGLLSTLAGAWKACARVAPGRDSPDCEVVLSEVVQDVAGVESSARAG
jgi:flagellar protein FliS